MKKTKSSPKLQGTFTPEIINIGESGPSELPMSIPELVKWLWEKYPEDPHVISSLMRLFGAIADSSIRHRKLIANITCKESFSVLVDILSSITKDECSHDQVYFYTIVYDMIFIALFITFMIALCFTLFLSFSLTIA